MKKIEIEIRDETFQQIKDFVDFYNLKNKFFSKEPDYMTIENFIKGSIIRQLNEMDALLDFAYVSEGVQHNRKLKNRFKELFDFHGIKATQISELTGIESSTLSNIFHNKTPMSLENFMKLWTLLNNPPIRTVLYRE